MSKEKIIVFDLYETLIHEPDYSWERVYSYLVNEVFTSNISVKEVSEYCLNVWAPKYRDRGCNEIDIADEINDLIYQYGIKEDLVLEDILLNCLYNVGKAHLFDDTIDTLETLKKRGYEIHLLSNCIYHKAQMKYLLNSLGITKYFDSIHFSSDYMVRKPSKKFFGVVVKQYVNNNPNINLKDIIYCGDNFECDVFGSNQSGLTSIFINRKNQNVEELKYKYDIDDEIYTVNSLKEILKIAI